MSCVDFLILKNVIFSKVQNSEKSLGVPTASRPTPGGGGDHMAHYGTIRYLMVPYGTIWYLMVPYGTIWYHMVAYGSIWYHRVP